MSWITQQSIQVLESEKAALQGQVVSLTATNTELQQRIQRMATPKPDAENTVANTPAGTTTPAHKGSSSQPTPRRKHRHSLIPRVNIMTKAASENVPARNEHTEISPPKSEPALSTSRPTEEYSTPPTSLRQPSTYNRRRRSTSSRM